MEEIVVYMIVTAAATALVLKIRKGIKNKGKCDGCSVIFLKEMFQHH